MVYSSLNISDHPLYLFWHNLFLSGTLLIYSKLLTLLTPLYQAVIHPPEQISFLQIFAISIYSCTAFMLHNILFNPHPWTEHEI
jgi:hypothetical protein